LRLLARRTMRARDRHLNPATIDESKQAPKAAPSRGDIP
jgi:hypothetical protein